MEILILHLFKSCAPFTNSITHINNEHIDAVENIDITMLLYNLIEYSDNYSDTSGILWKYKRHELPVTNDVNPDNFSANNWSLFKYKSGILAKPAAIGNNGVLKKCKNSCSTKISK